MLQAAQWPSSGHDRLDQPQPPALCNIARSIQVNKQMSWRSVFPFHWPPDISHFYLVLSRSLFSSSTSSNWRNFFSVRNLPPFSQLFQASVYSLRRTFSPFPFLLLLITVVAGSPVWRPGTRNLQPGRSFCSLVARRACTKRNRSWLFLLSKARYYCCRRQV